MSPLPRPLRGIVPPMVTPLVDCDTLDVAGLERLIEHILSGEPTGLFILGTTGEGPSLSYHLRRELIERVCRQVASRVPVLVGVTDTSLVESVNVAEEAAEAGADAVVLAAPPYIPAPQPDLVKYIEAAAAAMPLPIFLYNMPSLTKVVFEPDTVRRAMQLPGVVGLKDSSADMIYFHRIVQLLGDRPDFSLLIGPEELLAESLSFGGHGGVCGGANLRPRLYVDLYNAAQSGDRQRVEELHRQIVRSASILYRIGGPKRSVIKGLKCALSVLGICGDQMAQPLQRFAQPEREQVRRHLDELGLLSETSTPAQ